MFPLDKNGYKVVFDPYKKGTVPGLFYTIDAKQAMN